MARVFVSAEISRESLMTALRQITINNEHFRHEAWSLWDAEVMEAAAQMIREGYAAKQEGTR